MVVLEKKAVVIDEDYTIYKRIVKLEDGSNMYQLHTTCDKNFNIYMTTTFTNLKSAKKIFNQI